LAILGAGDFKDANCQMCKDLHDEEMQLHLRGGEIINSKTATGLPNYGCNSNGAKDTTSL